MTTKAGDPGGKGVTDVRGYGMEDPWFCEDAAALTGLKYGWAIASLAVSRSWIHC